MPILILNMGNRNSVGEVTQIRETAGVAQRGEQCNPSMRTTKRSPSTRRRAGMKFCGAKRSSPKKASKAALAEQEFCIAVEEVSELRTAAQSGEVDYVRDLLDMGGVDPNAADHNQMTALHYAAMHARDEVIKLLIQRGADPNASDLKGGFTPLHWVVIKANPQTSSTNHVDQSIVALYRGGANIHCTDFNLCTPLHIAAQRGDKGSIDTLIRLGADPEKKDGLGRSCLDVAKNEDIVEQMKLLKLSKDTAIYSVLDTDACSAYCEVP